MLRKKNLGLAVIVLLAITTLLLWLPQTEAGSPVPVRDGDFAVKKLAEILASVAMVLMAFSFVLAARFRALEDYFGGLDRMYSVHKALGIVSLWLLIAHKILIPEGFEDQLGPILGRVSLIGFVALTLLTVIRWIPYHIWRPTHRFMGTFYIVGIVHTFVAENMIIESSILGAYLRAIAFSGAAAYLYTEIIRPIRAGRDRYRVARVTTFNEVVELRISPVGRPLRHKAGQFAFLSIRNGRAPREPHPFTISSGPEEEDLRFTIKALGNYTGQLADRVEVGDTVLVDGPFGRFDPYAAPPRQIWIAGGVGITPFLSALRSTALSGLSVDLFYAVPTREAALFLDEIEERCAQAPGVRFHLFCSAENQRVTMHHVNDVVGGQIAERDLFLCGPESMVKAFTKQARSLGVDTSRIHDEKFAIR